MVGKVVVDGNPARRASHLKPAPDIAEIAQGGDGLRRRDPCVPSRRDSGNCVQAIVFAEQLPAYLALPFPHEIHGEVLGSFLQRSPVPLDTKTLNRGPAAALEHAVQRLIAAIGDDQPGPGNCAHEVVKLVLNRCKIGEDIGMIEFEIVQYDRLWTVMHKFRALVEKRRVVFIGLNDEKRPVGKPCGDAEVAGHATDQEARLAPGLLQNPSEHRRSTCLTVGSSDCEHPLTCEHVLCKPLWPGDIWFALIEYRLYQGVATGDDVSDHP